MSEYAIELKNLTKNYGAARGIKRVSLSLELGTILGFLGPNGAGKSTTINILLDFIRPTSGSAKIFGLDARHDSVQIHRRVGFLAGDMSMDNNLTGWQQLEYFGWLRADFDKQYISSLAKRLDCSLNRKIKTLSRGNKQKVGLISSLMHKPDLLIFDEPTSGLDPLIQAEFNKILREHKQAGGSAFISSHVLGEIQEICDEVAFIREGKLVDTKPITEVAKNLPRNIKVSTKSKDLLSRLSKFAGLTVSEIKGSTMYGTFSGDTNKLLRLLAGYTIENFSLSDVDLETVFVKYYGDSR